MIGCLSSGADGITFMRVIDGRAYWGFNSKGFNLKRIKPIRVRLAPHPTPPPQGGGGGARGVGPWGPGVRGVGWGGVQV